jgi:hypothetical protein
MRKLAMPHHANRPDIATGLQALKELLAKMAP